MERRSFKTAGCFERNCPIARAAGYGHWQSLPAGFLGKEPVRKKPKKKIEGCVGKGSVVLSSIWFWFDKGWTFAGVDFEPLSQGGRGMQRKNNLHKKYWKRKWKRSLPLIRSPPEEVQHLGDVQLAMSMMGNKLAQEVTVLHSREKSSTSLPYRLMGKLLLLRY